MAIGFERRVGLEAWPKRRKVRPRRKALTVLCFVITSTGLIMGICLRAASIVLFTLAIVLIGAVISWLYSAPWLSASLLVIQLVAIVQTAYLAGLAISTLRRRRYNR